jgi:hypothetical protein
MAERNTEQRNGDLINPPVAASTKIEAGKLVCANATGYAVEGSTATTLTALGRAEETVDNSAGADGALTVQVRRGTFKFKNSATNPVTQASLGKTVYVEDDETVAKDASTTKSAAGKCVELASDGVWVEIR